MPQTFENLDPPYTWTQTLSDVDVFIKLPPGISTKSVNVSFRPDTVKVEIKGSVVLEVPLPTISIIRERFSTRSIHVTLRGL